MSSRASPLEATPTPTPRSLLNDGRGDRVVVERPGAETDLRDGEAVVQLDAWGEGDHTLSLADTRPVHPVQSDP
jgi:hypothetical protein